MKTETDRELEGEMMARRIDGRKKGYIDGWMMEERG